MSPAHWVAVGLVAGLFAWPLVFWFCVWLAYVVGDAYRRATGKE